MKHTSYPETCAQDCSCRVPARWLHCFVIAVLLAAVPACRQASTESVPAQADVATKQETETADSVPPRQSEDASKFVKQELEDLTSPFIKETVLALNAIVSRSLAEIEEFDQARRELKNNNNDAGRIEILAKYTKISRKTRQAREDMAAAAKRLQDSGERYNEAIFAAMVRFVDDVDDEIRAEIAELQ